MRQSDCCAVCGALAHPDFRLAAILIRGIDDHVHLAASTDLRHTLRTCSAVTRAVNSRGGMAAG